MDAANARTSVPRLATLVAMTSVGPLALNIFVPALPAMAQHFNVEYSFAQLLVSLYLFALAAVQLVVGPASDRLGRRPVLLVCLAIFCVATIGAIYAPSMHQLLGWRVLQAFSAAGVVLSRAIVRDTAASDRAASMIGYVTMGMGVTPMVAPFLGGWLTEHYGWQSSFWVAFAFGFAVLAVIWLDLKETNLTPSSSFVAQFRAYPHLLGSTAFWGYTLTATFASGVFFAFLGGGPYISTHMLGMTPSQYGFYFSLVALGYVFGNYLSGRLTMSWGMNRMMMTGNFASIAGLLVMLGLFAGEFSTRCPCFSHPCWSASATA